MNLLKELYCVHAPSGGEKKIKKFIAHELGKKEYGAVKVSYDSKGNMYIVKGDGAGGYPCIVAHLDQVQDRHAKDFMAVETEDIIFGYSPSKREQQGLGADDKNGIWIALKCLQKYADLKVAFFVGEEVGCVGSHVANMDFFKDCRFLIQPDRRGYKDLIWNISGTEIASEEFLTDCGFEKFGFSKTTGLMTDVLELTEKGVGLSCINVSCGYYEPHTDGEFTVKKDLLNCLDFVHNCVENCRKVYAKEYVAKDLGGYGRDWDEYGYGGYRGYYGGGYGRDWDWDWEEDEDMKGACIPIFDEYCDAESWLEDCLYWNPQLSAGQMWKRIKKTCKDNGITKKMYDFFTQWGSLPDKEELKGYKL